MSEIFVYPTVDLVLFILLLFIALLGIFRKRLLYPIIGIFLLVYARFYTSILDLSNEYSALVFFGFLLLYLVIIIENIRDLV